jgi:hypothetical protein
MRKDAMPVSFRDNAGSSFYLTSVTDAAGGWRIRAVAMAVASSA